nr:hypothetical protein [Bradyrhizobium sp. MOS001]
MRALCRHGKGDVRVDIVPDPKIQRPRRTRNSATKTPASSRS